MVIDKQGKPQVFTLYVDNQIVGHGSYRAENKYDTLTKTVAVYVTKIYHSSAERFVVGEKYDWNILDLGKNLKTKGKKPK